jgi:hypothetical protein
MLVVFSILCERPLSKRLSEVAIDKIPDYKFAGRVHVIDMTPNMRAQYIRCL